MILNLKRLGDGSERLLIHWLIEDESGPIQMHGHPQLRSAVNKPADYRARIACNPEQNTVNPQERNGERLMCLHSGEVTAATCPKCLATDEAKAVLKRMEEAAKAAV